MHIPCAKSLLPDQEHRLEFHFQRSRGNGMALPGLHGSHNGLHRESWMLKENGMKQFKITKEWLDKNNACESGKRWFLSQKATTIKTVVEKLIVEKKFEWANWTVTKVMTHKQNVQYACYSALQSIDGFEKLLPNDKNPRLAIEAALRWADESDRRE